MDILVSCLTRPEERELELTDKEGAARRSAVTLLRSPIEDRGTPTDSTSFEALVNRLDAARQAGHKVAIHCRQGLGRAPLVAASLLIRSGMTPDDTWTLIAERRDRSVPDTEAQREWVSAFGRYLECDYVVRSMR